MFTRLSNFTYDYLQISNIDEIKDSIKTQLVIFIQKYEQEALRLVLGDCLYADLMAQLELDDAEDGVRYWKLKEDADAKWGKLLNGDSYEVSSIVYPITTVGCGGCGCCGGNCGKHYWDGILRMVATVLDEDNEDVPVIESILAPYIYRQWAMSKRTLNFGVGEGTGDAQTAIMSNTKHKRIDAWNQFVKDVAYGDMGGRVSLQQYLREHATDFPEAEFLCFQPIAYDL